MPRWLAIILFTIPWLAAAATVSWILVMRIPPNGVFRASTTVDGKSPFINPFLPSERVTVPGAQPDGWSGQRITGDPTYFTALVPGPYDRADIDIEFRPIHQPLFEFGLVRDAAGNDLDMSPMFSGELQGPTWQRAAGGYVRTGVGGGFLIKNDVARLATWDATSTMPAMSDPAGPAIETQTSLRGSHDFYAVPSGDTLDITFELQDVNRKRGTTVVAFRVFRGDEEIKRESIETNGSRETAMGKVFDHRIRLDGVKPGVIRIAFQADDDVFIRSVRTTSRRWVIGPRLNVGDVVGYATTTYAATAWTNSRHVVAETFHQEGFQTLQVGPSTVKVVRTHEPFRVDRTDDQAGPVRLTAPKGDIRLVGDGWFALREDAFFEPKPTRMTDGMELDREKIDGVITAYERPTDLGDGWYRASFSYPLDASMDRLRFVLSAPGIAARVGAVDIRKIDISYRRPALSFDEWWNVLRQEAVNAWRRI